ncbi:MAG: hypothetical protein QOJ60_1047, partial [Actinomycetota bacterium]|nr:hypothetical protein [Actinomycetota bacterium]
MAGYRGLDERDQVRSAEVGAVAVSYLGP